MPAANLNEHVGKTISLLPEDFIVEEGLNVRPAETDEAENNRIEILAKTIAEEGQLQAGRAFPVVNKDEQVEYHLFIGNRRRAAIALHNAGLGSKETPLKMRVEIVSPQSAKQHFRQALIENIH